jgi:RHS repeat-associated protein
VGTTYRYDNKGRLVGQTQTVPSQVNGVATNLVQGVTYDYNGGDHLTRIVYPSGITLIFSYAAGAARPSAITLQTAASAVNVLDSIAWQPFGAARSWKWGGMTDHVRSFDDAGRLTRYPLGLHTRDVSYDSAGRISGYKHYLTSSKAAAPTLDQSFGYDKNSQLTNINLYAAGWIIDYDANGNRKSVTIGATTRAYGTEVVVGTMTPKSNRLKTLSNPAVNLSHWASGQTQADETRAAYGYDLPGRLNLITLPGYTTAVAYQYDANGLRLRKYTQNLVGGVWVINEASQTHFVYDPAGHLLGEYDKSGAALREYVWLDDTPVALFVPSIRAGAAPTVYDLHTDHLNTPRAVMDTAGNLRWRWIADPFGTAVPETNPAGLGAFVQNLRFPGQYADSETGLFYNMARNYDPMIGRYVESDPIGLQGGINTYAYVGGNPIGNFDPMGLDAWGNDSSLRGQYWSTGALNVADVSLWLDDNAGNKSQGKCAKYVRQGLEAGGANTVGHPISAADYANTLQRNGYVPIRAVHFSPQ